MASNNEYKVKVGVEFNAIMTKVNSALDSLQDRLKKLGSLTGAKDVTGGLSEGLQKIVNGFNELKDFTITPKNLNEYIGKLQVLEEELKAVGLSSKDINQSLFNDKNNSAAENIQKANDEIKKLESNIEALNKKKAENSATNPFTEKDAQDLKNYEQELQKAQKSLSGYTAYQTRLKHAAESLGVTEEQLTEILRLLAQAHKEAADASEKQREGQQQLDNNKLADTIKNQVNQYIGLAAIYRYTKKYIQDLVQTYKEFDQSLVAIAAVTGQTRDQMWANIGVYNKMAQSLGTTTQEVINASKLYYQQGLTTTSVLKLTEETVKLATIAELDSADATEYLTTAMNGFKLSAEESTRVTDVWANLAAKTASDVDELAIAISKVASLAENAGMEIETASAFLNQMIETTREAPENLGTALKTIIARFQELKTSEEELSDGVDANKVERALKTAGVALRDASGQFRDFDDVILELSSKWDGLDRNTQRYIATIAAGSRQQSRFIALVSDYEGLLRNVNYAYDSLGSADAQMAVFQEGLAASTNRLQAAWEGLYTSWSKSATVISKLIDGMADFVSTLADLGAGWSAITAVLGILTITILANAAANAINNKEELKGIGVKKTLIEAYKALIVKQAESLKLTIAAAAPYIALAAAIAVTIGAVIALVTAEKRRIKQLEKEATASRQAAAQTKDRASSLGVLATELENVHKASEDESEIRQKIIDQYGETINGVNVLTGSYKKLTEAMQQVQNQENTLSAAQYLDTSFKEQKADLAKEITSYWDFNTDTVSGYAIPIPRLRYLYNGKEYASQQEALNAALAEEGPIKIDSNRAAFIADTLIDTKGIESELINVSSLVQNMLQSSSNDIDKFFEGIERDKDGVITSVSGFSDSFVNEIATLIPKLEQSGFAEQFNALFNSSLDGLSFDMINRLIQELEDSGASQELITYFQNLAGDLQLALKQGFESADVGFWEYTIRSNLLPGAQQAFLNTFNSLKDDPAAQEAYTNSIVGLIHSMNPEEITGAMVEALGDADLATQAFSSLLDGLGNLKDESLAPYFNQLRLAIGETNAAFEEGKAAVDAYYDSMASLADLQKGGMSNEDYLAKLYDEAAMLAEVTDATYEEIVAEMLKATTLDESGQMVLQQTELLAELANMQYESSATTIEAKRAELLAYADAMDVYADELEAIAAEAEGKVIAAQTGVESGNVTIEAGMHVVEAQNKMGEAAQKAWEKVEGSKNTSAYNAVIASTNAITAKLKTVNSKDEILALANEARSKAIAARAQAAQLSINKLANSFNKAGKGASKAAKETDKYKDALKELNDKLKEAKEEAERYIDAVLDYLDDLDKAAQQTIKDTEENLEKERNALKITLQAWKDYIDERQEENQRELELQGKAADMYFKQEIAAIQAKIDALNDEAEAEDRILKLQKARDDYNKAQNSRTRLVLTKGAGWIFKTDQNEVKDARKALNDVQREIQKANYQKQLDDLQAQATAWQEIAEKIGESAAEAERLAGALKDFTDAIGQEGGYADVDAYAAAVKAQQEANDEYARLSDEVDQWLEQADWTIEDYNDRDAYEDAKAGIRANRINEETLATSIENLEADTRAAQVIIDQQQRIIDIINGKDGGSGLKDFYNLQKSQLGLTQAQLDAAKAIVDAIDSSYDETDENLGLGADSEYYKSNLLGLMEKAKNYAEQIAELEAKQALEAQLQANTGGGGSAGGGGGSGSGSRNTYIPITNSNKNTNPPVTPPNAEINGIEILNQIRDKGAGVGVTTIAVPVNPYTTQLTNPGDKATAYNTNTYNISVNTSASTIAALVQDIQRNTAIRKTTTYSTR